MKQVIFLSTVFAFLSFFVHNREVLAAGPPGAPPPAKGPGKPAPGAPPPAKGPGNAGPNAIKADDPRLSPQKYCIGKCAPTVIPKSPFDAKKDATAIYEGMKKVHGTNEALIITKLASCGNAQRQQIAAAYTTLYQGDMLKALRGETSGGFESVLAALLTPFPDYLAKELHNNIAKKGIDERMMVENLCTLNNYGIKSMAESYQRMFGKPLLNDVKADSSGSLQKIMISSAEGKRDEGQKVDNAKAVADAQALHKSKGPKWAADTSEFNTILGTRSFAQLKQIFIEYKKISGQEIEADIDKEFKGVVGKGLLAFVMCARSKAEFLAARLHRSMTGIGTREATLTRVIVSRSEIDLAEIKTAFQAAHKRALVDWVNDDTSGDYKGILVALVKGNTRK